MVWQNPSTEGGRIHSAPTRHRRLLPDPKIREWPGCCLLSASSSSSIWSISIGKKRWIRTASVVQCDETNPKKEPLSEARTDERKLHLDEIDKLNGQSFNDRTVNVEEAKSPASNEGPHPQKRGRW